MFGDLLVNNPIARALNTHLFAPLRSRWMSSFRSLGSVIADTASSVAARITSAFMGGSGIIRAAIMGPFSKASMVIADIMTPIIETIGALSTSLLSVISTFIAETLAPAIVAILSPEILIPAVIAAGMGYLIYKGAQAIDQHVKDKTWYQDQITGAVAPVASGMQIVTADDGTDRVVPMIPTMPDLPPRQH